MEERVKIKELEIRIRKEDGTEGWIKLSEFTSVFIETVGEAIDLTFKKLGKEMREKNDKS